MLSCREHARLSAKAVEKPKKEQRHLAQSHKGAEAEMKIKQQFIPNLCVSASLREFADLLATSLAWSCWYVALGSALSMLAFRWIKMTSMTILTAEAGQFHSILKALLNPWT